MWSEADDERVKEFCKTVDVGKLTKCPKCGMGEEGRSEMILAQFCTHKYCPFREWWAANDTLARTNETHFFPDFDREVDK